MYYITNGPGDIDNDVSWAFFHGTVLVTWQHSLCKKHLRKNKMNGKNGKKKK